LELEIIELMITKIKLIFAQILIVALIFVKIYTDSIYERIQGEDGELSEKEEKCEKPNSIFFMKTHKTASSTVQNLIFR
jgi:hypothetical protein